MGKFAQIIITITVLLITVLLVYTGLQVRGSRGTNASAYIPIQSPVDLNNHSVEFKGCRQCSCFSVGDDNNVAAAPCCYLFRCNQHGDPIGSCHIKRTLPLSAGSAFVSAGACLLSRLSSCMRKGKGAAVSLRLLRQFRCSRMCHLLMISKKLTFLAII